MDGGGLAERGAFPLLSLLVVMGAALPSLSALPGDERLGTFKEERLYGICLPVSAQYRTGVTLSHSCFCFFCGQIKLTPEASR